jgi:hypothetical protein
VFPRANSGYNSGKVTSVSDVLSVVKAFQIDGIPLPATKNSLRRRLLTTAEMPKFGQHATFSKTEEELATPLVTLDSIFYGLTVYAQKVAKKLQMAGRTGFWVF